MTHPLLEGLNPEQRQAVEHVHGPLLILAGAGSGKTRVLTRRVAWMVENGIRPWNILAVTFTNKAAGEMKERVAQLVGAQAHEVWVSTFHSSCVRILRRDIGALDGWSGSFVIWDDDDQTRALKQILAELKIDPKRLPPARFRSAIDRAKNALKTVDELDAADRLRDVYVAYERKLREANALDFNDLINKVVELWRTRPEVLERWSRRFAYVMVDEYQDTNPAQYELLKLLAGGHQNLAVVGDDDQSIYSFRGADVRNILSFTTDFPAATVVRLERNYRSTANILAAASAVVKNNAQRMDKTLRTDAPDGDLLSLRSFPDEDAEADAVVGEIRASLRERKPSDFAIIYRTNSQSRPFENALARARIPYVLVGGRKFYERREVRDLLGYLRLILNPADDMSFRRIVNTPTRGIGEKAVEGLTADALAAGIPLFEAAKRRAPLGGRLGGSLHAFVTMIETFQVQARHLPPGELVAHVADTIGYLAELRAEDTEEARDRIANIEELSRATLDVEVDAEAGPMERLVAFMDRATLAGQADELPDDGTGAVTLLTAHLAKGLEYPEVFLVGMAEGTFPHARAEREEDVEEERRLVYVAITRARERLHVSFPRSRRVGGGWMDSFGSRFIEELPRPLFGRSEPARPVPSWLRAPPTRTLGVPPRPSYATPARPAAPAPARALPPRPSPGAPSPLPPRRPASLGAEPTPGVAPRSAQASLFASPPPPAAAGSAPGRRMAPDSLDSFTVGVDVWHPLLGVGTIQKRDGTSSNPRLTIHFRNHGPRTVFAVSARMEIVLP